MADLLDTLLADDTDLAPALPGAGTTLRFTIARFALRALLDTTATVIPTRDVMPVLKNFHINATAGRLRITATDMELSMISTTPMVSIDTPGTAVLPARKILDILRAADPTAADVTIRVTDNTAHISIGRATWTLKLAGGHDYPAMPAITDVAFTAVNRTAFLTALNTVRYAASRDANRASLNIIDIHDGRMTTCDGSRFQQSTTDTLPDLHIPIAAADHLIRLLKNSDLDTVNVGTADNHLIFRLGTDLFIVNKTHVAFPDLQTTFLRPALANRHRLTIDRAELAAAITRVRINADKESSAIALALTAEAAAITARDKLGNAATETIPATWTGPDQHTIVVNHQFLTDLLSAHTPPVCEFRLGDDTRTRKSAIMLTDDQAGTTGVIQQMLADWVGQ